MVEFLTQFQLSIFSILSLTALLISIYQKEEIYSYSNRLFKAIILITVLILILEIFSWSFDGVDTPLATVLNYGFNLLVILVTPVMAGFWASYIDYKVYGDIKRIKRRHFYMYGFYLGVIFMVVNLFTPILFKITEGNVYERGIFVWINLAVIYLLLLHALVMVIRKRKSLNSNLTVVVVMFLVLPAIAAYIQLTNVGLVIMWPTLSIAVIATYLFMETSSASKDYLTGLYNRSRFDEYILRKIEKNDYFTVIMIDLDDYKKLNDTYGHYVGDKLIIIFGNILKSVFSDKALVSRYGGDEFIIICNRTDESLLEEHKKLIQTRIAEYDDEIVRKLKFSIGYSIRTEGTEKNFQELLTEADDMMYQDKAANKNFKRRKSDE